MLEGFEQHQKGDECRFACDVVLGQETRINGRRGQFVGFPIGGYGFELPIGSLIDSRHRK